MVSLFSSDESLVAYTRNCSSNVSSAFLRLYARITMAFLSLIVDDELTPDPISRLWFLAAYLQVK